MSDLIVSACLEGLQTRTLPGGGFAPRDRSSYRTDATAWGIMALTAAGRFEEVVTLSRARLAQDQLADGRLPVSADHPEAFWPTPLAILAWNHAAAQREARSRASQFLLKTTGTHWRRRPDDVTGNDPEIRGWPWIMETHSWVGSTGITIIALQSAGYGAHERVAEAGLLLLDRQLAAGGWNYGNTSVFGTELRPMPESTGIALSALKDRTTKAKVQGSIKYLKSTLSSLRTPYSLAWALLGLGAWGEGPGDREPLLAECLKREEQYGAYDTMSLSLLLLARLAPAGLESIFARGAGRQGT